MTGPWYCGSIFTAVCAGDVVAPPINRGCVYPSRCISLATCTISSSEGVIRPDKPIRLAPMRVAVSRIFSQETMTPKSTTSKLLHCRTTPTMFLPMSWTSPLTVAITTLPFERLVPSFSCSMYGISTETAFFMTRADLTTCGRNILPAPNRSPTTFMPSMSGPSITSSGRLDLSRASSVSSRTNSSRPLTNACFWGSPPGGLSHSHSAGGPLEPCGYLQQAFSGIGAPREHHVLAALAQIGGYVLVDRELARVHDTHAHARAYGVVEKHRVHGFAHRIVAAKRKRHVAHAAAHVYRGHALPDRGGGFDEIEAVAIVLLDAGRHREDIRVEDDVFGRESDAFRQERVGTLADRHFSIDGVGLAPLVEVHHDHGGAVAHAEARVREKRLLALLQADRIDDGLALHALEARLDHRPFGGIDHDRHARDIRFARDHIQELGHGRR